jgi:hypothetical protein
MIRKLFIAVAAAAITAVPASSTSAGPPQEVVLDDYIVLFPDVNINRAVFINITARDFCDWLDGGQNGPPPAIDPVPARAVSTGQGAIVGAIDVQDLYIEIWEFDDDPPPLVGPCEDLQDQLGDPDAEPWATGTAGLKAKTNDFFGSGTRGISFGDRTTAHVTDQDGNTYGYRNVFRLNEQCNAPEFEPASCLVDNSQLKML